METATASPQRQAQIDPGHIMQVGSGYWAAKTLLAAVKFGLFTHLAKEPMTGAQIREKLGLHPRSLYDFLDALTGLGFLQRKGLLEQAVYSNAPDTDLFLDKNKPAYIGGILEMLNDRLYRYWGDLEEGLRTGKPQNEKKGTDDKTFASFYSDPDRTRQFMEAMAGIQMGSFIMLAKGFDWTPYHTLCDIGGATGALCIQVALNNPHMQCTSFDLPAVEAIAKEWVNRFNIGNRVKIVNGDFFKDEFPKADVIAMGNILHDWGLTDKKKLIAKAYAALPKGGAFIVIENIIDSDRKSNVFGLLMSLNMLIETHEGFDFTAADHDKWCREAGFSRTELMPLAGPTSATIAYK